MQHINAMKRAGILALAIIMAVLFLAPPASFAAEGDAANASGDTYVLMNIPYDVFYKAQGASVDTVSSATTKVRDTGLAGSTYTGEGDATTTAKADITNTTTKGVTVPVKVSASTLQDSKYTEVTDATSYNVVVVRHGQAQPAKALTGKDALHQAGDYAYYKLSETPSSYVELKADGSVSAATGVTEIAKDKLVAAEAEDLEQADGPIIYNGYWGTYQVNFGDALPDDVNVAGIQVVTDKLTFGLSTTNHIWRSSELAWSVTDEGLSATNGATLQSLIVYTDKGTYRIAVNQKLKTVSTATPSASLKDGIGTVSGLPKGIKGANATVSITEGSGHSAVTTPIIVNRTLNNGKFDILSTDQGDKETTDESGAKQTEKLSITANTEYDVTIYSDNYAPFTVKATYSGTPAAPLKLAKAKITSVKAGKKSATVKWNSVKNANVYELQYSTSKSFKKGVKTVKVKATKKTVKKLKSGKKYYFRVSGCSTKTAATTCGAWSAAKSVKVK